MKGKIVTAIAALVLAQSVFAGAPLVCPTVAAISTVGVNNGYPVNNQWMLYQWKNNFGTETEWSLHVVALGYESDDPQAVLAEVNAALPTLRLGEGPKEDTDKGKERWMCQYESPFQLRGDGEPKAILAVTISPPGRLLNPASMLKKSHG